MLKFFKCFLIVFLFNIFCNTETHSAIINAKSCSQSDVQAAIDQAQDGDSVLVPAGTCTWTTPAANKDAITIKQKRITLKGKGIDQTTIIDGTGTSWGEGLLAINGVDRKPFRITGFTFNGSNRGSRIYISGTCKNWRIDNCKFESDYFETAIEIDGYSYGVIDHCTFINMRGALVSEGLGDASWQRPLSLGTAEAVYIEDNIFNSTVNSNVVDANGGGRYVFRHNKMTNSHVEAHSGCPNGRRGTFSYEIYENTIIADKDTYGNNVYRPFLLRGGTGVIYDNTILGDFTSPAIHIDNQRSCLTTCGGYWKGDCSLCDGDCIYDGNTPGMNGYPCRDQIGRSTDSGITTPQVLEPLYEWNNTYNGQNVNIILNPAMCPEMANHIKENRDFYNDTPRPGYTPYQYPHPLTLLVPPSNLRIE
jgi:hypothetical protein